jgi:HK97 family phage major capsid protein
MIARLPPGSLARAQWLITPDAIPALFGLTIGNVPAYLPLNSPLAGRPSWMLFGLPVTVSQHAAAFSSLGDLLLFDGQYYRALTARGQGIQTASSMHLYFDADATAFRAIFRVDGQPKIVAQITQAKGSNALSPFVQLASR